MKREQLHNKVNAKGFDLIGAASRLRSLSTVVHGQQPKSGLDPTNAPAAGFQPAPAAADDSQTAGNTPALQVVSPRVVLAIEGQPSAEVPEVTTSTWRLPSPSPSPPRPLPPAQQPLRHPPLAHHDTARVPSPADDVSPSPSPPRFRQAERQPPPAGARREQDEDEEEDNDESPSPPRFHDPNQDQQETCRTKRASPAPFPSRCTPSPPPRRGQRGTRKGRREEARGRGRGEGGAPLQDWGEEQVDHPLLDISFSDGKVTLPRQAKPRGGRSVYSSPIPAPVPGGKGKRRQGGGKGKGHKRPLRGQRIRETAESGETDEGSVGWPTADVSQVRVGGFSVSSVRALYRLRREDEAHSRLRSKEGRARASKASTRGLGGVEERRGEREEQEEEGEGEEEATKEAAKVSPPPSLERALAASGRPFTLLNGVSHETLSLDLFGKLALLQTARTALREGQSVLARSPLGAEEGADRDCRVALSSLYMSCVQLCRDPAVPPLHFDASCRCFELLMEPKRVAFSAFSVPPMPMPAVSAQRPLPPLSRYLASRTAPAINGQPRSPDNRPASQQA